MASKYHRDLSVGSFDLVTTHKLATPTDNTSNHLASPYYYVNGFCTYKDHLRFFEKIYNPIHFYMQNFKKVMFYKEHKIKAWRISFLSLFNPYIPKICLFGCLRSGRLHSHLSVPAQWNIQQHRLP